MKHPSIDDFIKKFWDAVDQSGDCWLWKKSTSGKGYGQTAYNRKHLRSHRVAYEFAYGPIPKGMKVLHSCDNPPCCNPGHLFLGTTKDNSVDMVAKGRSKSGISFDQARTIRRMFYEERISVSDICQKTQKEISTITRILTNRAAIDKEFVRQKRGAVFLESDIVKVKNDIFSGKFKTQNDISKKWGVSPSTITRIKQGKCWSALP